MTNQIFIFTAANPAAQVHLKDTIENPILLDKALALFPNNTHDQVRSINATYGLYAWGAVPGPQNTPRWEALKPGDWMLCVYGNTYQWVCKCVAKFDNEQFARAIWGNDPDGNTWQLMYFLTTPQKISIPISTLTSYLNSRYMGFFRIGDQSIQKITTDYASVDNFMEKVLVKGEVVKKSPETYALIRSNEGSGWQDEKGQIYRFGSTVPNYKQIVEGAYVVVDSRINGEVQAIGYGRLAKAKEAGSYQRAIREGTNYEAFFEEWHAFSPPRPITPALIQKIQAVPGFNQQHAVRLLTRDIYNQLIASDSKPQFILETPMKQLVDHCHSYLASKGFSYQWEDVANLMLSIRTKPFVILAGISGTGKSKIVQFVGEALSASVHLIPVKPDWSDNTDLIGYEDFQQQFRPAALIEILAAAHDDPQRPFFILLDEMNLARVEHYFSDFLSIIETRELNPEGQIVTKPVITRNPPNLAPCSKKNTLDKLLPIGLSIPSNVYVFGTVNMDETTHPFSRKVLDRANTIEFHKVDLKFSNVAQVEDVLPKKISNTDLASPYVTLRDVYDVDPEFFDQVIDELSSLNSILEKRSLHFGFRIRDEVCFYLYINKQANLMGYEDALDYQIHQKILPRVYGGEEIRELLQELSGACDGRFPRSYDKTDYMLTRLEHGFTSFWI